MIDEIDEKIIMQLQHNARYSYTQLSKKLGISVATISRRIRKLIDNEELETTAVPKVNAAGYNAIAVIALDVVPNRIDEVCDILAKNAAVQFIALTFGRFDVVIHAYCSSSELLTKFVKTELSRIDGIRQIETFIVAELKKRTFGWLQEHLS